MTRLSSRGLFLPETISYIIFNINYFDLSGGNGDGITKEQLDSCSRQILAHVSKPITDFLKFSLLFICIICGYTESR